LADPATPVLRPVAVAAVGITFSDRTVSLASVCFSSSSDKWSTTLSDTRPKSLHGCGIAGIDGVAGFDAKDRMLHLEHTNIWYKTYRVRNDARFAYNLSPNDSLQSFDAVKGDEAMRNRLTMLQADPLNPRRCPTTFGTLPPRCIQSLLLTISQ
jgi:hypothetical protein